MSAVTKFLKKYIENFEKLIDKIDIGALKDIIEIFCEARSRGATIFFIGNGGSAALASHFAEDLVSCSRHLPGKPLRALSLTDSTPYITAIANDYGYEKVFLKQLENLYRSEDILVAISASGNSRNLVKAVKYINSEGGITIGILGFDGGILKDLCRHYLIVKTEKGQYGPVESIHALLAHIIANYFETLK